MNSHQGQSAQNLRPDFWKKVKMEDIPFRYSLIDGIVCDPLTTQKQVDELKSSFKVMPDDVFITTYMKSGTLWTTQIVRLITLRGAEPTDEANLFEFCPALEVTPNNVLIEEYPSPRYIHSHLPYNIIVKSINKEHTCKYIYTARNPKDVAVSLYNHIISRTTYKSNASWDEFLNCFMAGKVPYGLWYDHVLGWWEHRNNPNVLFLKFEERLKDPHATIRQIADFIGVQLTEEEVQIVAKKSSFDVMKKNPLTNGSWLERTSDKAEHLRKGTVGNWSHYFTEKQVYYFNCIYNEIMSGTGLELDFS